MNAVVARRRSGLPLAASACSLSVTGYLIGRKCRRLHTQGGGLPTLIEPRDRAAVRDPFPGPQRGLTQWGVHHSLDG